MRGHEAKKFGGCKTITGIIGQINNIIGPAQFMISGIQHSHALAQAEITGGLSLLMYTYTVQMTASV